MESYRCWLECPEPENLSFSDLYYEIKNFRLIEINLDNGYYIRQRKDLDCQLLNEEGETIDMKYGMLYCTSGFNIESVWTGDTKESLKEFIDTCNEYI